MHLAKVQARDPSMGEEEGGANQVLLIVRKAVNFRSRIIPS